MEKQLPDTAMPTKELPEVNVTEKELPKTGNAENTVIIGDTLVEIKPTKLKYLRNGTANLYRALDKMPLTQLMALPKGAFGAGDDRDGDKAVMDWLIAVTDNEQLIVDNYNDMDCATVYRIVEIFKRVNQFLKREEELKNALTPPKAG